MEPSAVVHLVLDHFGGDAALRFPANDAVWIIDSPTNVQALSRAEGRNWTVLYVNGNSPQEWLLNHADSVDQHHNEFSCSPAYSQLHVVGVTLNRVVEDHLRQFGFCVFAIQADGLIASKALPTEIAREA
jgi:hypothetical protein